MTKGKATRRQFLRQTCVGVLGTSLAAENLAPGPQNPAPAPQPLQIVAALGDTLIPTEDPQYPGYQRLEPFGISNQVWNVLRRLERVTPADLALFNNAARDFLGKTFLELDEAGRASYVAMLLETGAQPPEKPDHAAVASLQKVLRLARERIFTVFYRNFPYDTIDRDETGTPIPSDKEHQIINPKKSDLITGWDIAGYRGPLSWEEEEERRKRFQKIHWHAEETSHG